MRRAIAVTAALVGGALIVATALLGSVLVAEALVQPAFAQHLGEIPHAQTIPSRR